MRDKDFSRFIYYLIRESEGVIAYHSKVEKDEADESYFGYVLKVLNSGRLTITFSRSVVNIGDCLYTYCYTPPHSSETLTGTVYSIVDLQKTVLSFMVNL